MGARLVIGDRLGRVQRDGREEGAVPSGRSPSSPCAILGCVGKGLCEHRGSGSAWAAAHLGVFIHGHGQDESKCNDEADPCFDSSTADRREHGAEGEDLLRAKLFWDRQRVGESAVLLDCVRKRKMDPPDYKWLGLFHIKWI